MYDRKDPRVGKPRRTQQLTFTRTAAILAAVLLFSHLTSPLARAIPRFSLLTGTRCSVCHFNPQGSGVRTQLGWEMMNETGLFKWHGPSEDTSAVVSSPTNTLFGGTLIPGFDGRLQQVRLSRTGESMLIPMQTSVSLGIQASHQLTAYTNWNIASIIERARNGSLYPGETDYDAAIQYQPAVTLPSIRVGMIEPSLGIRQDDHTLFAHDEAAMNGIALIPPYYNELGAELTFEGIRWMTVNAGLYNSYNLSLIDPSIGTVKSNLDFSLPSVSARVMFWPQLLDEGINGEIGGSILSNGSLLMVNGFAGFGLADKSTLYLEALYAENADNRIIRNFSVIGSYELAPWLAAEWRYDWGQTEMYPSVSLAWAQGFLFGLEFFPLPMIEIRPEYRILHKNPYAQNATYTGQWTGQVHVFY
ncbi:MAG: hypothetical protein Q8922_03335 [Bacteroidota bacterium]|nr:hypothetical protein [Bacteroidota bacterium]MDP4232999.1 hypothetical protein [Bacteroidota bacterium]MDP4242043.1 hypothetical protein [Bacteroidota bacterium]MDP4286946.1 hypothetical protein [Bacteroidota bacterium]